MTRSRETRAVHGLRTDREPEGAVVPPIFQSAMFEFAEAGDEEPLRYIRYGNTPDQRRLERHLADLAGAEAGMVTASGMGAISCALLGCLSVGDHLLAQRELYGGTRDLLAGGLPEMGIEVDFVDGSDAAAWEEAVRPETRAVYLESLSNPLLGVADLEGAVRFCRQHGLVSVVDNTFLTPMQFRPAELGFDLEVHSATKYLNGHSDLVAGAVLGRADLVSGARRRLQQHGAALDPHACFLLARGLRTLALRVRRQAETAGRLAEVLAAHPGVEAVHYPGLPDHPGHGRARELFDGFGGMLSFEPVGGLEVSRRTLDTLSIPIVAPSLGGLESLVTRPAATSHASMSREEREAAGISDALVRVSVGIEAAEDLEADFLEALTAASG